MLVVFYISGHGFGHASRQIELIRALAAQRPDAACRRAHVPCRDGCSRRSRRRAPRTSQARRNRHGRRRRSTASRLDEDETARVRRAFYADFDRRVARRSRSPAPSADAALVVGDIPPLAFAAAARAGVPSVAIGNFTWDWIYGVYRGVRPPRAERDARDPRRIRARRRERCGCRCTADSNRWPRSPRDIPFIARRSTRDPAETRRLLGIRR